VKITVIIPTYRSAKFIERALLSICKQTMKPIEVIVVETGMEDEIAYDKSS
jgi:glycosyltransferase involved in cell wall biosynthesis